MRNVTWKFKVAGNDNTYFATSLKAINCFLRKNGLVLTAYHPHHPFMYEVKTATRCGWGVYGIPDNN